MISRRSPSEQRRRCSGSRSRRRRRCFRGAGGESPGVAGGSAGRRGNARRDRAARARSLEAFFCRALPAADEVPAVLDIVVTAA